MNKQTKAYRKLGLSTKVTKGTGGFTMQSFEIPNGFCPTDFKDKAKNPDNKRKSPWRGASKNKPKYSDE